jgi:hypothetical protein
METQNTSERSQQPATRPYPEPDESTPVQAVSGHQVSPPKVCTHFSSPPHVPPASSTSPPEISLTNEPSRLNRVLVEKLVVAEHFKKRPAVYESQKLISLS